MFWKFFKKDKNKSQLPSSNLMPLDEEAKKFSVLDSQSGQGSVSDFQPDITNKPKKIRLVSDEYHLQGLGKLEDETFFLVSSQLNFDSKAIATTDYVCKFCFSSDGELIDSEIVKIGIRGKYDHKYHEEEYVRLMPVQGSYTPADISISPFSVDFEGIKFGFIIRTPEDEEDVWAVEFMPGNTMAFFEPWDSGEYDT